MILVDTSVWIDFFRGSSHAARLAAHLETGEVVLHPWVLGELALGTLGARRAEILTDLARMPAARVVETDEVLQMIDARSLAGAGIGWVDAQLLGSALVERADLWTFDRKLSGVARANGVAVF